MRKLYKVSLRLPDTISILQEHLISGKCTGVFSKHLEHIVGKRHHIDGIENLQKKQ